MALYVIFAYNELDSTPEHKISIATLVNYLSVKNSKDIKEKLATMILTGEENYFSYYFSSIRITDNMVFYSYPDHLKLLLTNPFVREVSQQLVETDFRSKYSLFIYELILYYQIFNCSHIIVLNNFRNFLGLSYQQYSDAKTLHKSIITQSIYEINHQTPFIVSFKYEKTGKVVYGLVPEIICRYKNDAVFLSSNQEKYNLFLQNISYARYFNLSPKARNLLDFKYEDWFKTKYSQIPKSNYEYKCTAKIDYIIEQCIAPYEYRIDLWK
jgi:plasmid replication initiation protein